jgi:hypothetical protein
MAFAGTPSLAKYVISRSISKSLADEARAMGDEAVVISVGPEHKRYLIHKALLTKQSEYFDRAFNGSFKEANEQAIHFEEESPAAFDLLVGWLYQNHIPVIERSFGQVKTSIANAAFESLPESPSFRRDRRDNIVSEFQTLLDTYMTPFGNHIDISRPTTPITCEGTGKFPYQHTMETTTTPAFSHWVGGQAGNVMLNRHKNISAQQEYIKWSVEELRLADYDAGRYNVTMSSTMSVSVAQGRPASDPHRDPSNTTHVESKSSLPTDPLTTTGHIPGIPCGPSLQDITNREDNHRLALLHLCLFAETVCWYQLFNHAMTAYTTGEAGLSYLPLPEDHIRLIYQRAHEASPCRYFAANSAVSHLSSEIAQTQFLELIKEYPMFLEDIFKVLARNPALRLGDPRKGHSRCAYHVHARGERCVAANGDVPRKEMSGASVKHTFGRKETAVLEMEDIYTLSMQHAAPFRNGVLRRLKTCLKRWKEGSLRWIGIA